MKILVYYILGFNDKGTTEYFPLRMDAAKQEKALLIHFLTAERPEEFINYELQCRGVKQLTSSS